MRSLFFSAIAMTLLVAAAVAQDDSKQTITGTVVSVTHDALVVETTTGQMTFKLDAMFDRTHFHELQPGMRVEIGHKLDSQGAEIATRVDRVQEPGSTTVGSDRSAAEAPMAERRTASVAPRTAGETGDAESLPATASRGPLLALVSLAMALAAGALLVRAARTR